MMKTTALRMATNNTDPPTDADILVTITWCGVIDGTAEAVETP